MSLQNKGPIHGVDLPAELPLGANGWMQVVPRRDELEQVRRKVGDRTVAALEVALIHVSLLVRRVAELTEKSNDLDALLNRSGFDLSECVSCGTSVICIPDGLALCKQCAEKAGGE